MAFTVAAIAVAVVAAAVSAYATYEQGRTQSAIAKYNATMARQQAEAQRQAAEAAARQKRKENQAILAAQRARIGGSGVLSNEGTPLLVQMMSAEEAALEEANIRYYGESAARASTAEAVIHTYQGRRARQQGYIGAGASLLGGASSALSIYAYRNPRTGQTTSNGPYGRASIPGYGFD